MLAWLRDLSGRERKTMLACFSGWTLDAFDQQLYSLVIPTLIAAWGLTSGEAGLIGTVTFLTSSLGGWIAGAMVDRFGRVRVLQLTIAWYSLFTALCGLSQNFEQLFILRALHGLGFGGEWAAGAILMGEVIRDKYRGRAVGFTQSGAAVGPAVAALVYAGLFAVMPEAIAWRVLFFVGVVPALLVLWIRRSVPESDAFEHRRSTQPPVNALHLFSAFRGGYLWLTIRVSLMVAGAQGGGYALQLWMPTYLRTVRGLSTTGTGGNFFVQMLGALIGLLVGAYLADAIGRKATFMLSAVSSIVMVLLYMYLPVGNEALLFLGIPLNIAMLIKFAPMGPFMTELYPIELRGTGQGFCYNAGRAIGSFFPTMVGYASPSLGLGPAMMLFSCGGLTLMIVMLLMLPETRGRAVVAAAQPVTADN
jgi:MFS family permease